LTPDCTSSACVKCDTDEKGNEIYDARSSGYDINCLNTGYARDSENGKVFKWAIWCGRCSFGCVEEENLAKGKEYACQAFRQYEGRVDPTKATKSYLIPCQFVQLAECGCAPEDVYTFGLDPPKKACRTKEDCPYLCSDAPGEAVKDLCNAFDIEWWLGDNFLNTTFFRDNHPLDNTPIVIEIYDEEPPES